MINFEIGKLYTCPEGYSLLVFPTKEKAANTVTTACVASLGSAVDFWSKRLNCYVSYIPGGRVFCIAEIGKSLKHDYCQIHVVAGEAMGWINLPSRYNWAHIEELVT